MVNKILTKIKIRERYKLVHTLLGTPFYEWMYFAYWHALLHPNTKCVCKNYLAARPHPGAGIGHQIQNWNAGFILASKLGLDFCSIDFPNHQWNDFLGFDNDEETFSSLKEKGFKIVRIPLIDLEDLNRMEIINRIIKSYSSKRVIFLCEQDQGYFHQEETFQSLQHKFNLKHSKQDSRLLSDDFYNIVVHVRAGDILDKDYKGNIVWSERILSQQYFLKLIKYALSLNTTSKPSKIIVLTQASEEQLMALKVFDNVLFCINYDVYDSFLTMVYADILIMSKSSFSYNPVLLNNNIKLCPQNFWHGFNGLKNIYFFDDTGDLVFDE